MNNLTCPVWRTLIDEERRKPYFRELKAGVEAARERTAVYPPADKLFSAFERTPFEQVKVVILGQDPYHQPGQAEGMSFSVPDGVPLPPSLRNIYKGIAEDIPEFTPPTSGHLGSWADQGVLLLNTVLTVEDSKAHAHASLGWETFTQQVMERLDQHTQPLVFMLWGRHAQNSAQVVRQPHHLKLSSVHPSPLSAHRGFFGNQHFAKANQFLQQAGRSPINWASVMA